MLQNKSMKNIIKVQIDFKNLLNLGSHFCHLYLSYFPSITLFTASK
jgi:hypothetical protein